MSQCAVAVGGGLGGVQQRFLSVSHLRFKRLLSGGCTSGSMRGFGCESRAVRWVAVRSWKTVRTSGTCRSEWRVWLETYHGALVIVLRSMDWYRWMTAILDLVAQPHKQEYKDLLKMQLVCAVCGFAGEGRYRFDVVGLGCVYRRRNWCRL
jgi:hypothetical protein